MTHRGDHLAAVSRDDILAMDLPWVTDLVLFLGFSFCTDGTAVGYRTCETHNILDLYNHHTYANCIMIYVNVRSELIGNKDAKYIYK